jgi:XTP/dITP diphosphohydrolase
MDRLIFATNNQNKVAEVRSILQNRYQICTLEEAGIDIDIPEPFETLEENAREKARVIHEITGENCFSEDTGLEVDALNGQPGVKSARYAGDARDFQKNIDKLLVELAGQQPRTARFKTVVCLIWNNEPIIFEGICKGTIIAERRGQSGFGYDAVFMPVGAEKTFAEMTLEEKNHFSHRKKAIGELTGFLKANQLPGQ